MSSSNINNSIYILSKQMEQFEKTYKTVDMATKAIAKDLERISRIMQQQQKYACEIISRSDISSTIQKTLAILNSPSIQRALDITISNVVTTAISRINAIDKTFIDNSLTFLQNLNIVSNRIAAIIRSMNYFSDKIAPLYSQIYKNLYLEDSGSYLFSEQSVHVNDVLSAEEEEDLGGIVSSLSRQ